MMSLGEILVVALVALIVIKPEDIPVIFKKILQIRAYLTSSKNQLLAYCDQELSTDASELDDNLDELAFYLQQIIGISGDYNGGYSVQELKKKYQELVVQEINKSRK